MDYTRIKPYYSYIVFIIIVFFMIFSLWIRSFSAATIDVSQYITYSSPDAWYNFHQIELMIHNFPHYSWFDPMTAYPVGKSIDWGPLFPFLVSGICLLFGMTSRPEMMSVASWTGPIFAAMMVPLLYTLGKYIGDWKTGIVAAGVITFLSGLYFGYTAFGNVDHHALETFFSTLFCCLYIVALFYWRKHSSELKTYPILITGLGLSFLSGIVYFMGYLNMPTMILFGLIIAIYTFFQFILDNWEKKRSEYLFLTNLGVFLPVIIVMSIFGTQQPGMSLEQYSVAQIFAIFSIIIETILVYFLSNKMKDNIWLLLISILGIFIAIFIASRIVFGDVVLSQLTTFFGQPAEITTITESKPWSIALALNSFNLALLFALVGFILLLYQLYKKRQMRHLFLVIWSLIIFFATVQHFRYEYYFVVNMALLSSLGIVLGITTGLTWLTPDFIFSIRSIIHTRNNNIPDQQEIKSPVKKIRKKNADKNYLYTHPKKSRNMKIIGAFILVGFIILTILMVTLSIENDITYSTTPGRLMNTNWVETMEWLSTHTPDPGVNYFMDYQKENFVYPATAYGILSWWDYGHYITFISKRIPNTNPFQDNLDGPSGAAAFYMANSEENGSKILDTLGTRYVITNTNIATDEFTAVATWYDPKIGVHPYMQSFFQEDAGHKNLLMQLNGELSPYYWTMITRLHNFDGSMQTPGSSMYLEYYDQNRIGLSYPMVTDVRIMNVTNAQAALSNFIPGHSDADKAIVIGQFLQPLEKVPALQHFRLIHESVGNSSGIHFFDNSGAKSLNLVKVFEFVKGAHIGGEGVIELKVVTNSGREFTYRQESINGEFIVPYSTINNPYDVKTVGNYHILGTNRAIDVSEEDVLQERAVGG